MPQGKGTYGSKVGRPPKKKYYGGGKVGMSADPFSTKNPEGLPTEQIMEAIDKKNVSNRHLENVSKNMQNEIPIADAQERSQTSPDVTSYNEGGKVKSKKINIADIVKEAEKMNVPRPYSNDPDISIFLHKAHKKYTEDKKGKVGKMVKKALK